MTDEQKWTEVDRYICDLLVPSEPALEEALRASDAAGLPPIQVAPNQGKLLHLLAKMCGARRILEIGTLGGYSTIWLARALPREGKLITLEFDPKHAKVAQENFTRAGLSEIIEVRVGPALETLPQLADEKPALFDFIFIDANKEDYPRYFEWAMKLARVGTVIVADNVVRKGEVANTSSEDKLVRGAQLLHEAVAAEKRVSATTIQTVGSKGYDGFSLALVLEI